MQVWQEVCIFTSRYTARKMTNLGIALDGYQYKGDGLAKERFSATGTFWVFVVMRFKTTSGTIIPTMKRKKKIPVILSIASWSQMTDTDEDIGITVNHLAVICTLLL